MKTFRHDLDNRRLYRRGITGDVLVSRKHWEYPSSVDHIERERLEILDNAKGEISDDVLQALINNRDEYVSDLLGERANLAQIFMDMHSSVMWELMRSPYTTYAESCSSLEYREAILRTRSARLATNAYLTEVVNEFMELEDLIAEAMGDLYELEEKLQVGHRTY